MEREIDFRGKRIDNGEWVYGYLFKSWDKCYILWGMTNEVPNMKEVDPETVGQYTGLKDRTGKKIYEQDELAVIQDNEELYYMGVVTYGHFNCRCCEGVYGWYLNEGDIRDIKDIPTQVIILERKEK